MKTPQDRTIQVGKICARYWQGGGGGSPVLLLHGLGEYVEIWLRNFDALAVQHRVYAVDFPGHGRTGKPLDAPYDGNYFTGFAPDFLHALGIERAHIIGHSLGGAVATRLALDYPDVVDRIVLVDSGGLGREGSVALRIMSLPLIGEWLMRPSESGAVSFYKEEVYDVAQVPQELLDLHDELAVLPGRNACFLKTLRANVDVFGQKRSVYERHARGLSSLRNPVLLVWGREDRVVPLAHGQAAARALPDAQLEVFEHCGHCPMLEHAEAFNHLALEFLAN
jgi:4,5:9,10-diseco-3-hydroxy-5,9,17-trioxoandrosta-1(10),2-diene-4-oate hydrolase